MEFIIAMIVIILVLIALRVLFHTSTEKVKALAENEELNKLTDNFPENKSVCKKILNMLGNTTTKIEEDEKSDTCLYLIMTDKIIIGNVKNKFVRIQTIAHECIHSMQDKKTLWFNFIYSNIYLLFFIIISALTIAKIATNTMLYMFILTILGLLYYSIRSYLESDAIIKARYLARNYMYSEKKLKPEEIEEIVGNYDIINKIGVPVVNYHTAFSVLIKLAIYAVIAYTMGNII